MLNADSSALNSDERRPEERDAADDPEGCRVVLHLVDEREDALQGAAREGAGQLLDRKSEASARCTSPSSDSARNVSGTNESSAKYATIAARWGPRSAIELRDECPLADAHRREFGTVLASETMDAAQALADLTEISSQIEAAVLFDEDGEVLGSTLADDDAAKALARAGAELLERAQAVSLRRRRRSPSSRPRPPRAASSSSATGRAPDRGDDRARRRPSGSSSTT